MEVSQPSPHLLDNLTELSVLREAQCGGLSAVLVSNWTGSRVYSSASAWGCMWFWVHKIAALMDPEKDGQAALRVAIVGTHKAFIDRLEQLNRDVLSYSKYVSDSINGYKITADPIKARRGIVEWMSRFSPLIHGQYLVGMRKILSAVEPHFKALLGLKRCHVDSSRQARAYQNVIDIEGRLGMALPFRELDLLATGRASIVDEVKLRSFLDVLAAEGCVLGVRTLHRALWTVVAHLNSLRADPLIVPADLGRLEWELLQRGCSLLESEDKAQTKWRKTLEARGALRLNGRTLTFSQERGARDPLSLWHSYTCVEEKLAILVPPNQALAAIEVYRRGLSSEALMGTAPIHTVYPKFHALLVERLDPLCDIGGSCAARRLEAISKAVAHMMDTRTSPRGLQARLLGWNHKHELKCLFELEEGPFDYLAVCDMLRDGLGAIPHYAHRVAERSGLCRHPAAELFTQIVVKVAKGQGYSIRDEAAFLRIPDPGILARARQLQAWAQRRRGEVSVRDLIREYLSSGVPGQVPGT